MARIAVVGVGAVGATLAAAAQVGGQHELVLCDPHLPEGLTVEGPTWSATVLAGVVARDPGELAADAEVDWVLLAVKTYQTVAAVPWLERLCGPGTGVVVLQNGVEQRERVAVLPGASRAAGVLPAIVWFPASRPRADRVVARGPVRISVPDEPLAERLADALGGSAGGDDGGAIAVERVADLHTDAWRKLCFNAVTGLQALAGRPAGMFARAEVERLGRRYAEECVAVARADGARLGDEVVEEAMARIAASRPDAATSILVDRRAGRPLEWDARNGVIQRRGRAHGVPTPVSDVVVPLLAAASAAASG